MQAPKLVGLILLPAILLAYVFPVLMILWGIITSQIPSQTSYPEPPTFLNDMFVSTVASPDSGISLVRELLLPITAGLTVAFLWSGRNLYWTLGVVALCLISLVAIGVIWFESANVNWSTDVRQSASNDPFKTTPLFITAALQWLSGMAQTLITYLAVLLGLQQIPSGRTR